jgi:hypothetical protein
MLVEEDHICHGVITHRWKNSQAPVFSAQARSCASLIKNF